MIVFFPFLRFLTLSKVFSVTLYGAGDKFGEIDGLQSPKKGVVDKEVAHIDRKGVEVLLQYQFIGKEQPNSRYQDDIGQ